MRRHVRVSLFALVLVAGCGGKAPDSAPPAAETAKLQKLEMEDTKVGTGPAAGEGDRVWVTYIGTLANGKVFDRDDGPSDNPFTFIIGESGAIKGMDEGARGMQKGGKRKLRIPAAMAYGNEANGDIPPNSDLFFEVEMRDIVKKSEFNIYDKKDVKVGTGAAAVMGKPVTIKYKTTLCNGKVVDSSDNAKKPVTFNLGDSAIEALDRAIVGMKPGGIREVRIPPELNYSGRGMPPFIPANSVLYIKVEVLSVG